jgi:citrate synthase
MSKQARIILDEQELEYPIITGSEGERAIDCRSLRADTGHITFDEGYGNTGSCESSITYIDGEKGILRYRGYAIEELAEHSNFGETAYLILHGELPTAEQRKAFSELLTEHAPVPMAMQHHFEGFPNEGAPMAILSAMLSSLACYYPDLATNNREQDLETFDRAATVALSKVRTIAAMTYRMQEGQPFMYPRPDLGYAQNFLHMMFSKPYSEYVPDPEVTAALNLILLLHADHEQNCSTSTVRMVASSGANLFASIAAGVSALWGPLHGGANVAVLKMLQEIHDAGDDGSRFIDEAKSGHSGKRLMGFGHRVYKNYDPRAKIIGRTCDRVLKTLGREDPLLDIAKHLEAAALSDPYFLERKLYPNVDFYSGIIMRAIGIPAEMFTVMFAIGRMPGWIANWKEVATNPKGRINRPRQIYQGPTYRPYVAMEDRG